ncbi:MAG: FUSC family protein [Alphaproteobacteria bacterium]
MRQAYLTGLQLAVRASVAAMVALGLAQLLGLPHPVFAFIAAVIVTDLSPALSRQLGSRRIAATIIGAICGAVLSPYLSAELGGIALGVAIAILVSQVARARDAAKMAAYICGLILLEQRDDPWHYGLLRLIETILGVAVAWGISYVPKLFRTDPPPPTS